uniref:non-specific serine/threonine protein kinase n=1 Tax=Cajanus cajan TaxID=3821 RepID=A0A151UIP5_CAJCA
MIYVRLLLLLCFLLYHFDDITCNNDTERDVLLSFKLQVSDPENALSSWSSDSNHCTWIGVTCYEDGKRVQSLDLAGNALSGKLPPQLSNLTYLNSLDLSQNNFYGQIPQEFGHLQRLGNLDLSINSLTERDVLLSFKLQVSDPENALSSWSSDSNHCTWIGVTCYEDGKRVQSLDLAGNALSGKLPPQLSNLTYLNSLDLSQNNFYGQIPQEFGHLQRLGNLDLSINSLTGKLPNSFVGDIPTQLGNLLNLSSLQLSENNLSGHFPTSIFSISSLVLLYVENNNLSGNLAHNFGHDLPNLNFLSLGTNRFEGVIPNSISNASNLQYIDLANNKFHGPLPLFNNMINLTYLALDNNFLSPTTSLTFQFFDYLSNSTQLNMLKINDNHLDITGNFPQEIKKFENLLSLSFANNFFTGELPSEIGALHMLQNFATDGNRFSGEIPDIFGNLTNLYTLAMGNNQFSGRIHTSIGQCNRLFSLDLGMNRIGGTIPKEIFQLSYLTYLNLTGNSLHGSLPREVGTMTQLQTVDISSNQLSGKIPKEIEGCSSLKTLVMARNKFNGSIPTNLGNLEFLETLDLSSNNLTGPIPQSLQKLRYIETLNLSFNHLECEVPMKGVFLNLTKFDFRGNNQLCSLNREIVHNFQKKKRKILLPIILAVVGATALGLPQNISYGDIRIATNNFAAENLIGKGSFGCVYKGFFSFSTGETATLAVKVLDLQQSKASKSFNVECEALKSVRHRNLVKVITSCSSLDYKGEEFKAIVMQFMANGNLDASLYPKDVESGSSLTLLQRLNIAIDVASALDYLHHDCDPPIVHCDLKPANVLLDENMVARVADFGLARFLSQSKSEMQSSTLGIKGSIGYIAPEYGVGGKASTHGDVYSFGILLLEMFTGKRPTDEMFKEGLSLNKFVSTMEENQVLRVVDRRLIDDYEYSTQSSSTGDRSSSIGDNTHRTCKAEECVAAVIRVGLCCSTHRPKDRWRMRDATTKLQAIRQSMLAL